MALLNFDAHTVAPSTAPVVLPEGWYTAQITASEIRPTKDGASSFLQLVFTVIDGEHAGCNIVDRLNLYHSNPVVEEIAQSSLSAICHATGIFRITETGMLHGIPLQVRVTIDPARKVGDKEYAASNNVRGYRYANGSNIVASADPSAATACPTAPQRAPVVAPVAALAAPPVLKQQAPPVAPVAPVATPIAPVAPIAAPVAPVAPPVATQSDPALTPPWGTPPA